MIKLLKLLVLLICALGLLVFGVGIWLKTGAANITITKYVQEYVAREFEYDLEIQGLKFSLPIIISAKNIVITDKEGKFAEIENFHFSIVPSFNMFREVNISNISAGKLEILRIPVITKSELKLADGKPSFDPNVFIRQIKIDQLVLSPGLAPIKQEIFCEIKGGMNWKKNNKVAEFAISSVVKASNEEYLQDMTLDILGNYNTEKNQLNIGSASLESKFINIEANGRVNFDDNKLSGTISYDTNIAQLILRDRLLEGESKISGKLDLSGTLSKLLIESSGEMSLNFLNEDNFHFPNLNWHGNVILEDKTATGEVKIEQGVVTMTGKFDFANNVFALKDFVAKGPEFLKTANITIDTASKLVRGAAKVTAGDIKSISQYLPFISSGSLDLVTTYSSSDNQKQSVSIIGNTKNLQTKYGNAGSVNIAINIPDLFNLILAPSTIDIKSLSYEDFILKEINISALPGNEGDIKINSKIKSRAPRPIDIKISSLLSFQKTGGFVAKIYELVGNVGSVKLEATQPIIVGPIKEGYSLEGKSIRFGDGQIDLSGIILGNSIKAGANLKKINIGSLPFSFPKSYNQSSLTANLTIKGLVNNPVIESSVLIENVSLGKEVNQGVIKLDSTIGDNKANIKVAITHGSDKYFNIDLLLPTICSLSPMKLLICKDQPFVVLISGHKPFNLFGLLPLPPQHKIKGLISGNMKATGTLIAPQLSGKIYLENGIYEYEKYGIRFNKIKSAIIASGNKISMPNVRTEDGLGNRLIASGEVVLTPLYPFKFNFYTDKFNLAGNPYLQGIISGKIDLVGNSEKAKASGNIDIGPFEIKIPEHFQTSIPELNITKVIEEGDHSFFAPSQAYQIMMDILVQTKEQVFVRGWGVNTMLKGKLAIEGFAEEPIIAGKLHSVRGKYREFGKILNVEKGELVFDGKIPPSPYINIVGLTTEAGTEIRLILSGSLFNPDVEIKATPALSDEDALSLLLFGENPRNISAFQALQLADSLRRLSGKGGGFDPLGAGRKILGVDDISVKTESSTSSRTVVGVGKYLTDNVYFEIEEGGETGSKTKIEVELTPKISIENINETSGGSTFGIKWRFDY